MSGKDQRRWRPRTAALHAGERRTPGVREGSPAIHPATVFGFESAEQAAAIFAGREEGWVYTRWANPTVRGLEEKHAALEGTEDALATASGMAAAAAALLSLLAAGDHVVAARGIYAGVTQLLDAHLSRLGIRTTFVDFTDLDAVRAALRPSTRVLHCETPANPVLDVVDLAAVAAIAREADATSIVDSTFAPPVLQRPCEHGIDLVVHSATKYLGGHGDAVAGIVAGPKRLLDPMRTGAFRNYGGCLSPWTAWTVARGLLTLPLRMEAHCANAGRVADFLSAQRAVAWVRYPGLASHPHHEVARRQMQDFGGMVAFELVGGLDAGRRFLNGLSLAHLGASLGDARTLATHPASTTHFSLAPEARRAAGITDGLVRLSVGIEDPADILEDLEGALAGL